MLLYDVLLFLHISAAIIWIGSGFVLQVLAWRALRTSDGATMLMVLGSMGALGKVLFVPASFATFALGLALVLTAGWSFAELWIVLGLCGFASTFLTGVLVLEPTGKKIGAMVARDGITAAAIAEGRRLLTISRIDYVVLFLVVAVMALKPGIGDVAILATMAAVLVVAVGVTLASLRGQAAGAVPASA